MTAFPESPFGAFDRITLDATPLAVIRHEGIRIDTGGGDRIIAPACHRGAS